MQLPWRETPCRTDAEIARISPGDAQSLASYCLPSRMSKRELSDGGRLVTGYGNEQTKWEDLTACRMKQGHSLFG